MIETILSNRTRNYAASLKNYGYRHPVIKAMLTVFSVLSEYQTRANKGEDADKFLSTLGFNEKDRKYLSAKYSAAFYGQGYFTDYNIPELFALIGVTEENAKILNGFNVIWVIFSSKAQTASEIIKRLFGLSKEGQDTLVQMSNLFENAFPKLYGRYFLVPKNAEIDSTDDINDLLILQQKTMDKSAQGTEIITYEQVCKNLKFYCGWNPKVARNITEMIASGLPQLKDVFVKVRGYFNVKITFTMPDGEQKNYEYK